MDSLTVAAESRLMTATEVGALLRCSERHVRDLAQSRYMPAAIRLGGTLRWSRAAILAWIDAGCPRPARQQEVAP